MPSFKLPRFTDAGILRSIEPKRLTTFLKRFSSYLEKKDFVFPKGDNFSDAQLQQLIGIFNVHDNQTPADMIEALFQVREVANDQGMEALLLVAVKNGIELPDEDFSAADLAMHIWLADPDLLRRANCERIVTQFQSFYCYMNRTFEVPILEMPSGNLLRAIESRINHFNRNRSRGGGATVWMYDFGTELAFLIRCGGTLRREEVMEHEVCTNRIRRPVGYDLVVYNRVSGELRIRAELVGERRFYGEQFGEVLFNDKFFFEYGEMFNLDVIYELEEDIQSPGSIAELREVILLEIQETLVGQRSLQITLRSDNLFEALREHNKNLSNQGRITFVKLRFLFLDGNGVTVTIYSGNKIRFSQQLGLSSIYGWLIESGIRTNQNGKSQSPSAKALADTLANPKRKSTKASMAS
jgi:hypothetical protein